MLKRNQFHILVGVGVLWGLVESGLGPVLKTTCSSGVTGSVLCGMSFLFIAVSYEISRGSLGPLMVLCIAMVLKVVSGLLLGLPLAGGAIANPIFAFVTEVLFFIAVISFISKMNMGLFLRGVVSGITAAGLAVLCFPLVKYCTGTPACMKAGMPLAYYYSYVAISIASVSTPFGLWVGNKISCQLSAVGYQLETNKR